MSGRWLLAVGGGALLIALAAGISLTVRHFSGSHSRTGGGERAEHFAGDYALL